MLSFLGKLISGGPNFDALVESINILEPAAEKLSDDELKNKTVELKERLSGGKRLDDILPEAFALVREAAKRTLKQRHFDVQLMGGVVLHRGMIAEMLTGEGKTLAATAPAYLNALAGKGVHVVTVNEYLAKRDAVWMGQIYHALGLKTACLVHEGALLYDPDFQLPVSNSQLLDKERDTTGSFLVQSEFLRPISRREAYLADITYGTNHEFGFDYLRDNLAYRLEDQVQRGRYYAIIDEVDSILIDEARTPLIIAAPDTQSSEFYKVFARISDKLKKDEDYDVDEKMKTVSITDAGIDKVEKMAGIKNIYGPENFRLVRYLEESLRAKALFRRDRDYVVRDGEVIIVDQFTGRLMLGRRYSGGLHQAIEAKEGVLVKEESRTYASISIQNYFRMYEKLAGMTGTAQTSAEEFHKVYNLDVVSIPPNREMVRKDLPDVIYRGFEEKYKAITEEVKKRHRAGQPVLVGTPSIEKNEIISECFKRAGIPHEVLNAKQHEREGAVIAQAGKLKAVTIATNMAGRGVDIILGGNPPEIAEAQKVRELGGLHVIGTERHEARRIDNQLRGRAGRQGDPGSTQFFLSLEDELMRIFGGERIQNLMNTMNVPEGTPIESRFLSKAVSQAQAKVEGLNFDSRKHLLEYDDILNKQRFGFYRRRQEILTALNKDELKNILREVFSQQTDMLLLFIFEQQEYGQPQIETLRNIIIDAKLADAAEIEKIGDKEGFKSVIESKIDEKLESAVNDPAVIPKLLGILDMLWMSHLENMESLAESVRLRAYAQHDPLVEYRREGHRLYQELFQNFNEWVFMNLFKTVSSEGAAIPTVRMSQKASEFKNAGRNDPCPCGSGKKYKRCHGG